MSRLIVRRDYLLLPTSETAIRRNGHHAPADDPPVEPTALPQAAHASAEGGSAATGGAVPVAAPMLAPTVLQTPVQVPESQGAATPIGARLVRVGSGEALVIRDGTALIGRDRECDLVVSGPAVSRRHGIVRRSMRGYVLTDVSRNGIHVNGRRVRGARVLRTGDVLRIGEEEFRFEASGATCPTSIALPAVLTRRLARLRSELALTHAQVTLRVAAVRRQVRTGRRQVLHRVRIGSRLAWLALRRALARIRRRIIAARRILGRLS